jgi:hypothetical protein
MFRTIDQIERAKAAALARLENVRMRIACADERLELPSEQEQKNYVQGISALPELSLEMPRTSVASISSIWPTVVRDNNPDPSFDISSREQDSDYSWQSSWDNDSFASVSVDDEP